ncbi:MAG: hypothetical protein AB7E66_07420, partial [Parvibaculaceae bacterium]
MSGPAFSLNLGNGLYMDSEGGLHSAPLPSVPVYKAPFTLPVDPKKIGDALNAVKAVSTVNKEGFLHDRWGKVDVIEKLLDIVAGVGKIAGYVAPVFAALSVLVDVAKLVGFLKEGPSALETLVKEQIKIVTGQVTALAQKMQSLYLAEGRLGTEVFSDAVKAYVDRLAQASADPAQLEMERSRLATDHAVQIKSFMQLVDPQTWQVDFQQSEHTMLWPFIQHVLFTIPGKPVFPGPDDEPAPETIQATLPPNGLNFDHRLMFPLASLSAETYIACIRGISPEYRTTSEFRPHLVRFAKKLDDVASDMRRFGLARTIYKPEHFTSQRFMFPQVKGPLGIPLPVERRIPSNCNYWPVGAMDLRYHDDAHFGEFVRQLSWNEMTGNPGPTKFGTMDFRWIPPARLKVLPAGDPSAAPYPDSDVCRIDNPEECAEAANRQSEQDYADLLSISGYPELLRLAALMKNEATEPSVSQTVHARNPMLYRNALESAYVTVESNPVHYTGQIVRAQARREPQECFAKIAVRTQPIGRSSPVKYRVSLRTLRSWDGRKGWQDGSYADYQQVSYEPEPDEQGFLRLVTATTSAELDSRMLVGEPMSSPSGDPVMLSDEIDMEADTFDWWIPVAPPFTIDKPFDETLKHMRSLGWSVGNGIDIATLAIPVQTMQMQTMRTMAWSGSRLGAVIAQNNGLTTPELFWKKAKDPDGQRRDVARTKVHIRYELQWIGDELTVSLWGRPEDRSYIVYLAIEEQM